MADENSGVPIESLEEVLARHRKEKKNLQGQIQQMKHGVPKGDKKRKKEATEQIAKLETELQTKHTEEVEALEKSQGTVEEEKVNDVTEELTKLSTENGTEGSEEPLPKKTTRAQKRRDKKVQKAKERDKEIEEQEIVNLTGDRHLEALSFSRKLRALNLAIHEIHSDGNCMYNALGHQLALRGLKEDNESLRASTAKYMRENENDYLPFLCNENTGDLFSPAEFQDYCDKVEKTTAWGGQLELRALADVLHIPIKVLQGTGPDLVLGEEYKDDPLVLLYYRHAFGLGEHYNSVRPRRPEDEDVED